MKNRFIQFAAFACLGITSEIIFTAFSKFFESGYSNPDLIKLQGHTYVWMIFIYGAASFLIPWFYQKIKSNPIFIRLLLYALGIFIIEYISGFLLQTFTGTCPWKYTTGWHISGFIRLDYLPFWMFFGFILEKFSLELNRNYPFKA